MDTLKLFIFSRFRILFILLSGITLSIILLGIRIKLTHSFFLLFLVWNLFLAFVPYGISLYLRSSSLNRLQLIVGITTWLLLLPNAPYILTDFIHLQVPESFLILDFFIITLFSLTGIYLYVLSLFEMEKLIASFLPKKKVKLILLFIPFLCGFGVYLGRVLRWNSWDILKNPMNLASDLFAIVNAPYQNSLAFVITFSFGIILLFFYYSFKKFMIKHLSE